MMVSEDIPLAVDAALDGDVGGRFRPGMTVESHCDMTDGRVLLSREVCCRRLTSSTAGSLATVYPSEQLRYGE